jgi:hypothetical protein
MRKLILIATIATMSSSSCYANLSLASNDPAPVAVEQTKADQSTSTKPVTSAKPAPTKMHKKYVPRIVSYPAYQVHSYTYGHCL